MSTTLTGNLFEIVLPKCVTESNDVHIIVHGCNAQGRMGSGFAKELRDRFPEAYGAYMAHHKQYGLTLGTNVPYTVSKNLVIMNAITQEFYGYDGAKYVSYDAVASCFEEINNLSLKLQEDGTVVSVHYPMIGAGLAGGQWDIIEAIIETELFTPWKYLYKLPSKD